MSAPEPPLILRTRRFVAIDKPAGWLSVPSRLGADDARPCAGRRLETLLNARLWPVHRLDLEVGGLLLFALDAEAHRVAGGWFETRAIRKTYKALTERRADAETIAPGSPCLWRSVLVRGKRRTFSAPHGKDAETGATLLATVGGVEGGRDVTCLWVLEPHTGRPHQLRFELARHGYPILGDRLYGATRPGPEAEAIALRCLALEFPVAARTLDPELPQRLAVHDPWPDAAALSAAAPPTG